MSQTATFTFSSMLQFTPDWTALSLTVERWLAVTLHMWLSGHTVERMLTIATPVNKPLEESSQPYSHPEAHTAFALDSGTPGRVTIILY